MAPAMMLTPRASSQPPSCTFLLQLRNVSMTPPLPGTLPSPISRLSSRLIREPLLGAPAPSEHCDVHLCSSYAALYGSPISLCLRWFLIIPPLRKLPGWEGYILEKWQVARQVHMWPEQQTWFPKRSFQNVLSSTCLLWRVAIIWMHKFQPTKEIIAYWCMISLDNGEIELGTLLGCYLSSYSGRQLYT